MANDAGTASWPWAPERVRRADDRWGWRRGGSLNTRREACGCLGSSGRPPSFGKDIRGWQRPPGIGVLAGRYMLATIACFEGM